MSYLENYLYLVFLLLLPLLSLFAGACSQTTVSRSLVDAPDAELHRWPSNPPENHPFEDSKIFSGIAFTGQHVNYTKADTWYPSWASDGHYYSPWTDGEVGSDGSFSGGGDSARTGQAKIVGDDPTDLTVKSLGTLNASAKPYGGRYPCGTLVYDGVWYYGTYGLKNAGYGLNWPILGPFAGFRISTDHGKTWTKSPHSTKPGDTLFPEPDELGGPVKFGAPHFVDFGKNMKHSPDGKAYLVGHGSTEQDQEDRKANLSWITGDAIYLCRVKPGPDRINDESAYEYFAGHDEDGSPQWSSDYADVEPLFEWDNHTGCVTITYNPRLDRFLMYVTDGWPTIRTMDTYILESKNLTGPWRMVSYMENFGEQAYFVNVPSKFIGENGRNLWLLYSANFTDRKNKKWPSRPAGSKYTMSLHEMKLLDPGENVPTDPFYSADNAALDAKLEASSTHEQYGVYGAVDGDIGGLPDNTYMEWASNGSGEPEHLRLSWNDPVRINRIWLFDRPNDRDRVTSGKIEFENGTTIPFDKLPDHGRKGLEITFEPRRVHEMTVHIRGEKKIGLSEIAVFRSP